MRPRRHERSDWSHLSQGGAGSRTLALAVAGLLAPVGSASAATVSLSQMEAGRSGDAYAAVTFMAAPGETNRVLAVETTKDGWVLRDAAAPLSAGPGCVAIDANSASCTSTLAEPRLDITTGDGDDEVRVVHRPDGPPPPYPAVPTSVRGGDGDDLLEGSGLLAGGAGRDTLRAGAHGSRLDGGPGADVLLGGSAGDDIDPDDPDGRAAQPADIADDVIDGGGGRDRVLYTLRLTAITADLVHGTAGTAGEHDTLTSIEGAVGGSGNDLLIGDDDANNFDGGNGDDQLIGAGGDDILLDGFGSDRLDGGGGNDRLGVQNNGDRAMGGPGNDTLSGATGARLDGGDGDDTFNLNRQGYVFPTPAQLTCGAGVDEVQGDRLSGLRLDGCERASTGLQAGLVKAGVRPIVKRGGIIATPVTCAAVQGLAFHCAGHLVVALRRPGRTTLRLGRPAFNIDSPTIRTIRFRMTAVARRALRAAGDHPLIEMAIHTDAVSAPLPYGTVPRLLAHWAVRL